jgi:lactate dehydrogenase-like 2-hydroxyacid dehydrogenase
MHVYVCSRQVCLLAKRNFNNNNNNNNNTQKKDPITCTRVDTIDSLLPKCDVVSLHTVYNASTKHLINAKRLSLMKKSSILVNTARGPVVDEKALVAHLQANPDFSAALDVFEDEPAMAPGIIIKIKIKQKQKCCKNYVLYCSFVCVFLFLKNNFFFSTFFY